MIKMLQMLSSSLSMIIEFRDYIHISVFKPFERVFLPDEMQTHLRVEDHKKTQQDLLQRLEERKEEYKMLASSIDAKSKFTSVYNKNFLDKRKLSLKMCKKLTWKINVICWKLRFIFWNSSRRTWITK